MTRSEFVDVVGTKMRGGVFSLLVLHVIATSPEPVHGYAISKGLVEATGGRVHIQAGTLYPILKSLENHGLVRHREVPSHEGPPRKVYVATGDGLSALEEGSGLLAELVTGVRMTIGRDWPVLNVYG